MTLSLPQIKTLLGEPYLKLQMYDNIVLLPMKYTQEVLVVPHQKVTIMPNTPNHVIGLLNQRSHIYWLIDLSLFLELEMKYQNSQEYNIVIIKVNNIPLGLVVEKIKGVTRVNVDEIQSPLNKTFPHLIPYLSGCVMENNKFNLILNPQIILNHHLNNN